MGLKTSKQEEHSETLVLMYVLFLMEACRMLGYSRDSL